MKDVLGLLEHLEIDRCDLLGHSVGGMLAQRLAHQHADRFRSLVLMSTAPSMPATIPQASLERAFEIAAAKGMAGFQKLAEKAGRKANDPMVASWGERYWRHHRRRICAMTPESYRGFGLELYRAGSYARFLAEIHQPTLVLVGDRDEDFKPGTAALEAGLPKSSARCLRIADSGHHPHQENPAAWWEAVDSHLNEERLS